MKYFVAIVFLAFFTVPCVSQDSLTVICSERSLYTGNNGETAMVDYYLLSDSSLHFIKLFLAEVEFTLPQTVSGSGVRYSDGMDLTWWEKADSAMVQHRDSLGAWETSQVFYIR